MKTHVVAAFFLICFLAASDAVKYHITSHKFAFSDYSGACEERGMKPAAINVIDLVKIARLMRDKKISKVWIKSLNGKSYRNHRLSVAMVDPEDYSSIFAEHCWLQYGPEPAIFRDSEDPSADLPLVVPVDSSDDLRFRALCIKPDAARVRSNSAVNVRLQDSDATVTLRPLSQAQQLGRPVPSLSIKPVFNPPPNPPARAFLSLGRGTLPPDGTMIMVPSSTVPSSPRYREHRRRSSYE